MFPNRQKRKMKIGSEPNTIETHLLNEIRFNYSFKVTVLTLVGAKSECWPLAPTAALAPLHHC